METNKGKKIVRVPAYTKVVGGKRVRVPAHARSTPCKTKCR